MRARELFELHLAGLHIHVNLCHPNAKRGLRTGFEVFVVAVAAYRRAVGLRDLAVGNFLAVRRSHRAVAGQRKLLLGNAQQLAGGFQ